MNTRNLIFKSFMSNSTSKVVEGVFAINKPPSISSAEVVRRCQSHFNLSTLFAPWLAAERAARDAESHFQRRRRKDKRVQVKIGHGGTLDPIATGVLILGVGKGTKQLQSFLECTKSYRSTIVFGAATDTYDVLGKVLRRAKYGHVTREKVEKALERFRGKIMQRPPIYSALRVQGKRLYEYAREGKEVPVEIQERAVEVKHLEIVEWLEGGAHEHRMPEEEAGLEAKEVAENILHLGETFRDEGKEVTRGKRKWELDESEDSGLSNKRPILEQQESDPKTMMSAGLYSPEQQLFEPPEPVFPAPGGNGAHSSLKQSPPLTDVGPPAVKLRMTVTSGFYVRSLSHDLGESVGSLAFMSELVRTRQGGFELGKNVLEYELLDQGEGVWGPKVVNLLDEWEDRKVELNGVAEGNECEKGRARGPIFGDVTG